MSNMKDKRNASVKFSQKKIRQVLKKIPPRIQVLKKIPPRIQVVRGTKIPLLESRQMCRRKKPRAKYQWYKGYTLAQTIDKRESNGEISFFPQPFIGYAKKKSSGVFSVGPRNPPPKPPKGK